MQKGYLYPTEIGTIGIVEENNRIVEVTFDRIRAICQIEETSLIKQTHREILEYLEGKRKKFTVPIDLKGTIFQKQVWEALLTIPYGETRSYEEIAIQINNPKACRAIGSANHCNPIAIIVPCHRVIGKNKKLVGYRGGLDIKETLLQLEMDTLSKFNM